MDLSNKSCNSSKSTCSSSSLGSNISATPFLFITLPKEVDGIPKIEITLKDDTIAKIQSLVDLENFLNRSISNKKRKTYTVEDFIKGAIVLNLDSFNNPESLLYLSGIAEDNRDIRYHTRFKEIAKELGISQREISRMTGINPSNLNQIFNNTMKSNPRLDTFIKIWLVLGCPQLQKCIYRVD